MFMLITLASCTKDKKRDVNFYYWRTRFDLSASEKQAIDKLQAKTLYIRYFDLDVIEKHIQPVEPILFVSKPDSIQIVPVVYIRNKVFLEKNMALDTLADKTLQLIKSINSKAGISTSEIQLDCDWSPKTRSNYFSFVKKIKEKSGLTVSSTIRLHQIKYASSTGIPPMDYGVLMYYNMGKIAADNSNSIYDRKIALKYLSELSSYPTKLKVALPIFSWMVHSRNSMVIQVYNNLELCDFEKNNCFQIKKNTVEVIISCYFRGIYFQKNDILKQEKVENKEIKEMIADIENNGLNFDKIILFDLNPTHVKHIDYESLR